MDTKDLDDAIDRFRILAVKSRYEDISEDDFIEKYFIDSELRPYLNLLYDALEEVGRYSIKDLEDMQKNGIVFRQSPRYDFSCHEDSAKWALYSFSTGKNKFVCGLEESLENVVNLLENYRAVLEFKEKEV